MRITLVISTLGAGGAERVMSVMANYWAGQGRDITLITLSATCDDWYKLDSRVKREGLDLLAPSTSIVQSVTANVRRTISLRQALRKAQSDVVISFLDTTNVLTLMASRGLGIPIIVSERIDPRQCSIGRLWSGLRAVLYRYANAVVVQTDSIAKWACRLTGRRAIYVIHNPIRSQETTPRNITNSQRVGRTVIAMGRLVRQKGFDLLIEAFSHCAAKHADLKLVIIGEGPERHNLESLAADLGLINRVKLVGQVHEPAVFLKQADLFVMSSRYEGFPNALVEAMACGLAVISTDCPSGPRDIIRDGVDGVLVPPNDVESLAAAMGRLMADEAERQRLSEKAPEVAERFSVEKIMNMWDELLSRISTGEPIMGRATSRVKEHQ